MPFHFENKPSLIAYVTCGDPDLATTRQVILAAIDAGASVIELGVPFSDPLADGPVIQRASERALKHRVSLQNVLTLASEIREHSQSVGLVIFSYLNPILRMGLPKFCQVARLAGGRRNADHRSARGCPVQAPLGRAFPACTRGQPDLFRRPESLFQR